MGLQSKKWIGAGCLILSFILLLVPMPAVSAANGINDFQMNEATLAKYKGTATVVSVPDSVKVIGEEAFARNSDAGIVAVGKNVKEISFSAFAGCKYLTTVSLPEKLETVGDYAFSGCNCLSRIAFGPQLKNLGCGVFAGCNSLKEIKIDPENPCFTYAKGALYDDKKERLYGFLNGFETETYRMPDTVTSIDPYSFWGNQNLQTVNLSSYLQEIPGYAFSNCRSLRKLSIPYSVNSIDAKAFENCISLTDIEIPPSVSYIDPTAFDGCIHLNIIANEGTAAYDFYENFKKRLENGEMTDEGEKYPGMENQEQESVESVEAVRLDASKDPSNVDYMPDRDVLEMPEDENVKAKSIVVGGGATLFMNQKGVTVYEGSQNAVAVPEKPLKPEAAEKPEKTEKPEESSEAESVVPEEEKHVTVVGSTGSVLPRYVSDDLNEGKIAMQHSSSDNLDESPDTGDHSIPVNYILALGVAAVGVMMLLRMRNEGA